jgi:hypothetical protein
LTSFAALCAECVRAAQHRKACGGGHPAAWLCRVASKEVQPLEPISLIFTQAQFPKNAKPPRVVTKSPYVSSSISQIHSCVLRPAFFRLKESQRAGFPQFWAPPFVIDYSQTNNCRYSNRLGLSPALFNAILTFD